MKTLPCLGDRVSSRLLRILITMFSMVALAGAAFSQQPGASTKSSNPNQLYLQSERPLSAASFSGQATTVQALSSSQAKPLALASGDFDEDGVEDLVAGYSAPSGGVLVFYRGNLDAFAPQSHASWQAIGAGLYPDPFLPGAQAVDIPEAPDFVVAGDFNGDGDLDILVGARGSHTIYFLAGNGKGKFAKPLAISVGDAVTVLGAAKFDLSKPYSQAIVGTAGPSGSKLQIFSGLGQNAALVAQASLQAPATGLAFGDLDRDGFADAAIIAGGQLWVLRGSDVHAANVNNTTTNLPVESVSLPFSAASATIGRFLPDRDTRLQMAVLATDGSVHIVTHANLDPRPWPADVLNARRQNRLRPQSEPLLPPVDPSEGWKVAESFPAVLSSSNPSSPALLFPTHISNRSGDDVMLLDPMSAQVHVLSHQKLDPSVAATGVLPNSIHSALPMSAAGTLVAGLAMRVNVDGRPGVVVLKDGQSGPQVMMPVPDPTFYPNRFDDITPRGTGVTCLNTTGVDASNDCTLREAVIKANATAGADTIMLQAGTYTLTIPYVAGDTSAATGDLDIVDGLTIVGMTSGGVPATFIQSGAIANNGVDKIFSINPNLNVAFATSLSNLQLQYGKNPATYASGEGFGGAFDWDGSDGAAGGGTLILTNCTLFSNSTTDGDGGAITASNANGNGGGVTISNSLIQANTANDITNNGGLGGGILLGSNTNLTLSSTTITGNLANQTNGLGGGIFIQAPAGTPPTIAIHANTITNNIARLHGGGIYNAARLTIDQSTIIVGNSAVTGNGGGIWSNVQNLPTAQSVTLSKVTIANNSAGGNGGGINVDSNTAGGVPGGNNLTISFSRIAGNSASGSGRNLHVTAGSVTATNNWWGTNAPAATISSPSVVCPPVATTDGVCFDPFIVLTHTANPAKIQINQNTTLTGDMSLDNHGNGAALSGNMPWVFNLPITFDSAILGTIPQTQPETLSASAQATATFNAGGTAGLGSAHATVDQAVVPVNSNLIATATEAGNIVTITTVGVHGFSAGEQVTISGVGASGYNGTFNIGSTPSSTTFTFTSNITGLGSSSGGTASVGIVILQPPSIAKSFSPTTVKANTPSTITFTISNPNVVAINASFTDNLPANLVVANTPNVINGCGGSASATAGASSISFLNAVLPVGTCNVQVDVQSAVDNNYSNSVTINSTDAGNGNTSVANLTVIKPPQIVKAFGASSIPFGATTSLTFTITSTNANLTLSGISFTDNLPTAAPGTVVVATPENLSNTCAGTALAIPGSGQVSLTGAGLPPGASCTVSLNVQGTAIGPANNIVTVSDTVAGTGTTSAALITIFKSGTAMAVTSSANPSVFGQSVTFTATVSAVGGGAGTATGTVTFLDGGSPIGTGTLSGGVATFTTSALAVGNHTITTNYGGDGNFNGSTGSLTGNPQVVNKANTATTVTSSVNPSVFGQSVTFTATVSPVAPGAGTSTGTVTFLDGGSPIGTGTLSGGIATFTTSAFAVGNHTITTNYGGDGNFNGSTGSLTGNPQVVNKADTSTTVTSSVNPSVMGQSVTFTATVSPVAPGAGTPVGTVTFLDGGSPIGTGTLIGGIATFTTSALGVGNHTITTNYGGDGNFNGSTGSLTGNPQVVNKADSTTTVTSSVNPSIFGQSVTFTATVSPVAPGAGTATGTVTFLDGGSPIGTGTLSGGIATFTTSALVVGNHTITTSYGGDGNFNGSTGSLTGNPQVVNKTNTATTVTSSINPSIFGQSVTFTATVSAVAPGAGTPTGTVTFLDGGSPIGTGTLSGGIATFTTSALAVGNHTITTSYGGDPNFNGSTGSLTGNPQVVNKTNTTTTVTSSLNPSTAGQPVVFTATVSAVAPGAGTPTGTVTFLDGGTPIGTGTLSGGVATFTTSALAAGNHTITTSYGGDPNFNGSTGSLTGNPQVVIGAPIIAKAFGGASIAVGSSTSLTFTITNPAGNTVSLTGVAFTDNMPSGLVVATPNGLTGSCGGGTITAIAGAGSVSLSGATLPPSGNCSFSLNVTGTTTGTKVNTVVVTSANGGTGNPSTASITVNALPATHFTVTAPATATAGTAFNFTVTALDMNNQTVTGYSGTVHFTSSDLTATLPANSTLTNGVGTFSATLKTAGSQTITATDSVTPSITGTSNTITVSTAAATHFVVSAPATATSGTAFNFTVTALDQFNNTATGYTGTVHFTSSDGAAILPVNSTLTNGTGTFSATLNTGGNQTITATDTVTVSITGTSGAIAVTALPATHFVVSAPATATAGTAFNFTVTALDANNHTAINYTGTVHFTSTDATATLPANSTLTNGVGTFSSTLKTAGNQTITATDTVTTTTTGTSNAITVSPAAATHFTVSAPATANSGTAFNFTVTALDQFNNTATSYAGTVHFTSSDSLAVLPANSTLTNGVGTFSVTMNSGGNQTITATDSVTASITGTSNTIAVTSLPATHFVVSAPASATAGTAFNFTITALDVNNHTATSYAGTVHFTSTDGTATLPANSTLTNGVGTFSATLKTAGNQTITATDSVTTSITGTSGTIVVSALAATHFAVSAPATASSGIAFNFTVTALDQFNNTATSYAGTVHFTSSDPLSVLPANSALTNGVGTFSSTLNTGGNQTITATDTVTGTITGTSNTIVVTALPATHFVVSAPATATAGTAFNFTVTALDTNNHTVIGYAGTVHFTSTDGVATLPANSTLTSGVGTFSATLKTAGSQTITATDTVTTSTTGTSNAIAVSAAAATHFTVSAPATAASGGAFNVTVTALDQFNNAATSYTGTVHFTSTDPAGILPANSALTNGVGTFSATLKTAGNQTITATDTVTGSITGTSNTIVVAPPADLTIAKSHSGTFYQGETGAAYTITVSNVGAAATSGTVSVVDTLPASLTATAVAGTGWTCTVGTLTCTRSDVLAAGASYPAITVTVNVATNAPTSVTNTAVVSGGGEINTANDTANDVTTIAPPPDFSVSASPAADTVKAGTPASYTITLSPLNGVPFSNAINMTVSGLPGKSAFAFSPASVTPGANPGTTTLVLSTTAGDPFLSENSRKSGGLLAASLLPMMGLVLAGFGFRGDDKKRRRGAWIALVLILMCGSFGLVGCAGASHNFQNLGTPPGTYTVTVTGTSGSLVHSTTVTLTVQP